MPATARTLFASDRDRGRYLYPATLPFLVERLGEDRT
jgi:hypothetical protein